jgi:hypothetical protein
MAELLAKKKETKLLPLITDGRLGYLGINEDKIRFWGAKQRGKAIGSNGGHDMRDLAINDWALQQTESLFTKCNGDSLNGVTPRY